MEADSPVPAETALLLDRLVSASTAQDIYDALQKIDRGLKLAEKPAATADPSQPQLSAIDPIHVYQDASVLQALLELLATQQYRNLPVEEGSIGAARIFLSMCSTPASRANKQPQQQQNVTVPIKIKQTCTVLLQQPIPGRLLETLIDVACDSTLTSYNRVLALQVLRHLATAKPDLAQAQLMQAPLGLHRLADLLRPSSSLSSGDDDLSSNMTDIQVRNEALLVAAVVAHWPSAAKAWMFDEMGDVVMELALQEGGLTDGNLSVLDCLLLVKHLVQHDAHMADLVMASPVMLPHLGRLLDLRLGQQYLNPPSPALASKTDKTTPAVPQDDLDDLLQTGTKKENTAEPRTQSIFIPKLTPAEEKVIHAVFDILAVVLENEQVKRQVWKSHDGLCSLVWEMALIAPPPPGTAYPCAIPSTQLQQRALQMTALYFHDPLLMQRHNGLDRLSYLICTGGMGHGLGGKMQISLSAVHVIRTTMTREVAQELLLHTMAPPMMDESPTGTPLEPPLTPVQKLLNTAFANLETSTGTESSYQAPSPQERSPEEELARKVFLAGALNALSLFFSDESSRSIMFRLSTRDTFTLLDSLMITLGTFSTKNPDDTFVPLVILRFLCHWIVDAPLVVQAVLSSTESSILANMFNNAKDDAMQSMTSLVLGLCMEYMGEDDTLCGGWTRTSIMEMISSKRGSVSAFTSRLEKFKTFAGDLPWSSCKLEWQAWQDWYQEVVLVVRKRVVHEFTAVGVGEQDEDFSLSESKTPTKGLKSLQDLVSQQSSEIEELRASLRSAERTIATQGKQLASWKLRLESTPTQLDTMLSEYQAKTTELENKTSLLEEEILNLKSTQQKELVSRAATERSLREELHSCLEREKEARDERDSLRDELQALSQAYSSLEEEYREKTAQPFQLHRTTPAGEEESRSQPEGEASQQGSTEVATLRAENNRLRNDARAADEWMAMAVQRMTEIGNQNISLQKEIATLRSSEPERPPLGNDDTLRESIQGRSQVELETLRALEDCSKQLQQEVAQRANLEKELASARSDIQSSRELRDTAIAERIEYEKKVELLEQQLSTTSSLKSVVGDGELLVDSDSLINTPQSTIKKLEHDLATTIAERERSNAKEQEEIYRREARIRELEARLSSNLGNYSIDDIRSRDEEIAQLREANEAAQDWMKKAFEHHQLLSDQLSVLTVEKKALSAKLAEVETEMREMASFEPDAVLKLQEELTLLRGRCAELEECRSQFVAAKEENEILSSLILEQKSLIDSMQMQGEATKSLSDSVMDLQLKLTEKENELRRIQTKVAVYDQLDATLATKDQFIADLTSKLDSFASNQASSLKDKEWDETIASLTRQNIELDTISKNLKEQLIDQERESNAIVAQWEDSYASLEARYEELERQVTSTRDTNGTLATDEADRIALLEQAKLEVEHRYSEQSKESTKIINRLQERNSMMESKCEDFAAKMSSLEAEKQELQSRVQETTNELAEAHRQLAANNADLEDKNDKISELSSRAKDLAQQLVEQAQEAEKVITQWQGSYTSMESRCMEIEKSLESLQEEKRDLDAQVKEGAKELERVHSQLAAVESKSSNWEDIEEKNDNIAELEERVKTLEQQLAEQAKEAENVINQWQRNCSVAESRCREVEAQIAILTEERGALESQVQAAVSDSAELQRQFSVVQSRAVNTEEIAQQNERISELQSMASGLEQQLVEQAQEAEYVITQWQDSYAGMESSCNQLHEKATVLEAENEGLNRELASARSRLTDLESNSEQKDISIAELRLVTKSLEQELNEKRHESEMFTIQRERDLAAIEICDDVKAQLQSCQEEKRDLEAKLNEKSSELEDVRRQLSDIREARSTDLAERNDKISALESMVSILEKQMAEKDQETKKMIKRWEDAASAEESRRSEVEDQLISVRDEKLVLENELSIRTRELEEAQRQLAGEKNSKADISAILESKINEIAQLESVANHFEHQLAQQAQDAENAISQWQTSHSAVELRCNEFERQVETLLAEKCLLERSLEERLDELRDVRRQLAEIEPSVSVSTAMEQRDAEIAGLQATVARLAQELAEQALDVSELAEKACRLESQLITQERDANDAISQWEGSYGLINTKLREEQEALKVALNEKVELASRLAEYEGREAARNIDLEETKKDLSKSVAAHKAAIEVERTRFVHIEKQLNDSIEKVLSLESSKLELQKEIDALKEKYASASNAIFQHERLVFEKESIERKYEDLEAEMRKTVTKNEALSAALDKHENSKNTLQEEMTAMRTHIKQLEENCREQDLRMIEARHEADKRNHELKASHDNLQEVVSSQKLEIARLVDLCTLRAEEVARCHDEIKDLTQELGGKTTARSHESSDDADISAGETEQSSTGELQLVIRRLEFEMEKQGEEADDAISKWETRCSELENTINYLQSEMVSCISKSISSEGFHRLIEYELRFLDDILAGTLSPLALVVDSDGPELLRLTSKLEQLNEKILDIMRERTKADSLDVGKNSTEADRVVHLERLVGELGNRIKNLEDELTAAQEKLKKSYSISEEHESRVDKEVSLDIEDELERERRARMAAEREISSLEKRAAETGDDLSYKLETALADYTRAKEMFDAQLMREREERHSLRQQLDDASAQNTSLEAKVEEENKRVLLLEEELRELSDAMQVFITNEISERATDQAAIALRDQLEEIHHQLDSVRDECLREKRSREASEMEVARLRADIAVLLDLEYSDEAACEIQQRMIDATDSFQKRERAEIESLKNSLARALDDLDAAKDSGKETEQRLAKANLQISMYEQELVSAKGDLKFLTQTMDEMREAESSRRTSLEYRVSALENDQDVLRRFHSAEVENMRNELSHICMERDRLFQTLKESEKSREILLQATSRGVQIEGERTLAEELIQLRLEKAQLLSAAGEEASRVERRLREARAAEKSSAEADVILERELRLAAEKSLEHMKIEFEELRRELKPVAEPAVVPAEPGDEFLRKEVEELRDQTYRLQAENERLRSHLQSAEETKATIEKLTDECRAAKQRISQLEREGRFEADYQLEMARLQSAHSPVEGRLTYELVLNGNPAEVDAHKDSHESLTKLYDVIQKLKQTIAEDRASYYECYSEHEMLLAVLAKQQLIGDSLSLSLLRHAGKNAVDAALLEAEEKAATL